VYSARATGHVLLTSTNAGHVLYISLGQLSNNPWGITPIDSDPRMHRELDAHFHHRSTSSLTYASDRYLRHRFLHLVRAHPAAWLHKDLLNAKSTFTEGLYVGEFDLRDGRLPEALQQLGFREGRLLALVGYVLGFCLFGLSLWRRNAVVALITLVVVFQALMNVLTFYLPGYSANVILFAISLVGIALMRLWPEQTRASDLFAAGEPLIPSPERRGNG
jgi:hypothetical protein